MADEERLIVLLEARIRDLEKNMAKASGVTARTYRQMSLGSKRATQQMEQDMVRSTTRINQALAATSTKIGAFGKAMIGGFVGGLAAGGLAGVINQVREVADAVAEVGDQAKMAGLSTKAFQEWKFVAEQARIPVDAITDGLKELQLRADEFAITGKGSAAEAFQRLGLSPQEVKERLKDPSDLMLLIIERTRQMKDTAAGIRIFDELFGGTGGERMVALIEQGEQGIRDQIKAANDLGIVMDEQLIEKAAEIDRQFNVIASTVGTALKGAIVSAADALLLFIDHFREFENQQTRTLKMQQSALGARKLDLENESLSLKNGEGLTDTARDLGFGSQGAPINVERLREIKEELAEIAKQEALITEVLSTRLGSGSSSRSTDTRTPPPSNTGAGGSRTGGRSGETAEIERQRRAVEELVAELDYEYSLIGKSDLERAKMNALRQAGAAATAEERAAIEAKVEAIHVENEALMKAQEAAANAADAARDFAGTLVHGMMDGASATDALADAMKRLSSRLVDDVLDSIFQINSASQSGGGLFGSIFGNLFGGGSQFSIASSGGIGLYARGTDFAPGGPAIVGERGPELVNLPRGSRVVPNHRAGAVAGKPSGPAAGGTVDVKVSVSVDNNGNLQAYVQDIARQEGGRAVSRFASGTEFPLHVGRAVEKARGLNILKR